LVQLFTGNRLAMFLVPYEIGGFFILLFAVTLKDRRLAKADKPTWSLREFAGAFYVNPRKGRDFAWAFAGRFMFVLAYAFLTTYQAYYLLDKIGSAEADVPQQIFLGTLAPSVVAAAASLIVAGSLTGRADGRSSSSPRRSCTAWRCSWSPSPATSTVSSSARPSADSASACTGPSTSRSSPTCCRTRTTPPRISACSTSTAHTCPPTDINEQLLHDKPAVLTLEQKARLLRGADFWSLHPEPAIGVAAYWRPTPGRCPCRDLG